MVWFTMTGADVRPPPPAKLHNCCPLGISTPTTVPLWKYKARLPMKAGGVSELNPPVMFPVLASRMTPFVFVHKESRTYTRPVCATGVVPPPPSQPFGQALG